MAVDAGHDNMVKILCERKAKLNFQNANFETPLALAKRYKIQYSKFNSRDNEVLKLNLLELTRLVR